MDITITNEQQIPVTLNPLTQQGSPSQVEPGTVEWSVIEGDSTVTASEDGMTGMLRSADTPGDTQFLVKADADLGSGVVEISDVIRLTVQHANAASLGLQAGIPELKI